MYIGETYSYPKGEDAINAIIQEESKSLSKLKSEYESTSHHISKDSGGNMNHNILLNKKEFNETPSLNQLSMTDIAHIMENDN